jgi:hypothetical protein
MMSERGDFEVLREPFEHCAYISDQRLFDRFDGFDIPNRDQDNYDTVLAGLLAASRRTPLFLKDHAYYVEHLASPAFLELFVHGFIIRHPREALPSYYDKWPDLTLKEAGYLEQAALFDAVVRHTGRIPTVFDGDDLVRDPEAVVRAYCEGVGIPFLAHALHWEARADTDSIWHEHLVKTHGFEARTDRRYPSIEHEPRLRQLYDACLPAYQRLHRHRICIDLESTPRPASS